jgi:hypothetical protein
MKIGCSFGFLDTFKNHFCIKLAMHGSISSLRCVSMSKIEFFLVKEDVCAKLEHHGICNFFENITIG